MTDEKYRLVYPCGQGCLEEKFRIFVEGIPSSGSVRIFQEGQSAMASVV
jgi:hypothetical protein